MITDQHPDVCGMPCAFRCYWSSCETRCLIRMPWRTGPEMWVDVKSEQVAIGEYGTTATRFYCTVCRTEFHLAWE